MTRRLLVAIGLVVALAVVNFGIWRNERLLGQGRLVLLELAPVDPRSLMQGDYMALEFATAREVRREHRDTLPPDGALLMRVDEHNVARLIGLDAETAAPLAADEVRIRYRIRNGRFRFATDAWFFEEGTAAVYDASRYGGFRVDADGRSLLEGMYGEDYSRLGER